MKAIGFKMAHKWEDDRLAGKLNCIGEIVDDAAELPDAEEATLIVVQEAVENGMEVQVVAAEESVEEEPVEVVEDDGEVEQPEVPAEKPKKDKPKKVGVIASVLEFLSAASEESPISKDAIAEKLAERFPDRSIDSMKKTVAVQVPGRIKKEKGLDVQKNNDGYWVVK
jgi:hypothetical protein